MAVKYTATVKLATLSQRRRVVEGLKNLLDHCEALDSWPTKIEVVAAGTVEVTMTAPLPAGQLAHLGLVDGGI